MTWKDFTDSLVSPGGRMFLIVALLLWLGVIAFIMHETNHDPGTTGKVLISNAFTSLMTLAIKNLSDNK